MEKTTINGVEYDLETAEGCEQAKGNIASHIAELQKKKQEFEAQLQSCFFDIEQSQQNYAALQRMDSELAHCQQIMKNLDGRHSENLAIEEKAAAEVEIERVELQSAALASLCLKEIPAASRRLAFMAALLQENMQEIIRTSRQAEAAGLPTPNIKNPLRRLLGERGYSPDWYKNLKLPMLDESMDVLSFWPLTNMSEGFRDHPDIYKQVEEVLSSDEIVKTATTIFRQIEKRDFSIRAAKKTEDHIQTSYKPAWYERPRNEWPAHFRMNSVTAAKKQLGDLVRFWLGLEERRRLNAFIHLLNDDERDRVLEKVPQEEHQKYWDYLDAHDLEDELERIESDS